jgi:hypothetical protein
MDFKVGKAKPDEHTVKQPPNAGIIPKLHFRWILSGPSKSGKSNLARWVLDNYYTHPTNRKKSFFDRLILLSPTAHLDLMWADLNGLVPKDRISNPTPKVLAKIFSDQIRSITGSSNERSLQNMSSAMLARKKAAAPTVLLIVDDAIADSNLIRSPEFLKLFIQFRHLGGSVLLNTQSYMSVPRASRIQATHVSMFPSRATEIDRLYAEHGPRSMNRYDFIDMIQYATTPEPGDMFPFVHVDAFAPEKDRFRRNFTHKLEIVTSDTPALPPVRGRKRKSTARPPPPGLDAVVDEEQKI